MPQSYDVFMLNRRVLFRASDGPRVDDSHDPDASFLHLFDPPHRVLRDLPSLLRKSPDLKEVTIHSSNLEETWMTFCASYREIAAAGGVVTDEEGRVLWIQRNDKWDLPKGKLEAGESLEEAAIREVEEETGISALTVTGEAYTTFHTYESEGVVYLKSTFWFPMKHDGNRTQGVPQTIEGISDVCWLEQPFPESTLSNTFGSIKTVLDALL